MNVKSVVNWDNKTIFIFQYFVFYKASGYTHGTQLDFHTKMIVTCVDDTGRLVEKNNWSDPSGHTMLFHYKTRFHISKIIKFALQDLK